MGEVVRLNANPGDEGSWWVQGGGTQEEAERASDPESAAILIPWEHQVPDHVEENGALADLSEALWSIVQATGAADSAVTLAADALLADAIGPEDLTDAAATVALIQDVRRRLQVVEQYLTKRLGEAASEIGTKGGQLPDGRQWEVRRGKVRKAWDHESWKHDARAKIAEACTRALLGADATHRYEGDLPKEVTIVLPTGEAIEGANLNMYATIVAMAAQEVHGSTAPRVTQLRSLGMDPDEYAETKPGLWGLAVASPDPTTTDQDWE